MNVEQPNHIIRQFTRQYIVQSNKNSPADQVEGSVLFSFGVFVLNVVHSLKGLLPRGIAAFNNIERDEQRTNFH